MAIKERKQITGTTAQINAYEGHEGQIVWDKEKKTFVGMSGIAGKNYPLAQQAYVDEGLAGKEDKGVCLPLTGGELTGSLVVKGMSAGGSSASVYTTDPSKELMVTTGNADFSKGGGALTLYGRDHEMQGGWSLRARSRDDDIIILQGNPITRELLWGGKPVVWQDHSQAGVVRLSNDIMFMWDQLQDVRNGFVYTFPQPFANNLMGLLVTTDYGYGTEVPRACWLGNITNTSCTIHWSDRAGPTMFIRILGIGRWK